MNAPEQALRILEALTCDRSGCACQRSIRQGHGRTHAPQRADTSPSLNVSVKDGKVLVKDFGGGSQAEVLDALRERGLWAKERAQARQTPGVRPRRKTAALDPSVKAVTVLHSPAGLTVAQLAAAKKLRPDLLAQFGVSDYAAEHTVRIPYRGVTGAVTAVRFRRALEGPERFRWRKGDQVQPYGLEGLDAIRRQGWVLFVEGETDTWTGAVYGLPTIGVPGKDTWLGAWAEHFGGLEVALWQEPNAEEFSDRIGASFPSARILVAPAGIKDLNDGHCHGKDVAAVVAELRSTAPSVAELASCKARAELEAARTRASTFLEDSDPLARVKDAMKDLGYGGSLTPVLVVYLAATSRVLAMRPGAMPVHLLLLGPTSAGKTYTLNTALRLMPGGAYHRIEAGSPRVLIYDTEDLHHRAIIFGEADSLPAGEDNPAASAIRNLLQDHRLHYQVTVRGDDGGFTVKTIDKPGPSVLLTTAVRRLGEQLDSRLFSLELPDDPEQVRAALAAQAALELGEMKEPPADALAAQEYLQAGAPWFVALPFVATLAEEIGRSPTGTRILRDFARLVSLVKTVAVLRQARRARNPNGEIVATLDDYEAVRDLIGPIYEASATGAGARVRGAVAAVQELRRGGAARVSVTAIAEHAGITKMAASRAARAAARGGWLANNEMRKGYPANYELGEPLPPTAGLPTREALVAGGCNAVTALTDGCSDQRQNGRVTRYELERLREVFECSNGLGDGRDTPLPPPKAQVRPDSLELGGGVDGEVDRDNGQVPAPESLVI